MRRHAPIESDVATRALIDAVDASALALFRVDFSHLERAPIFEDPSN